MLEELRQALHQHLGGPEHYTIFSDAVGSSMEALHGMIAITVFARTADVRSGAFRAMSAVTSRVRNGVNLGIAKAANKGTVSHPHPANTATRVASQPASQGHRQAGRGPLD